MPTIGDLKITPLDLREFTLKYLAPYIEYGVTDYGSPDHIREYKKYLVENQHQHHYGNLDDLEHWYSIYTWDARTEYADNVLQVWLDASYTTKEVQEFDDKEAMQFALDDRGFEAIATMHRDDPSLIEFHDELQKIEKLLK